MRYYLLLLATLFLILSACTSTPLEGDSSSTIERQVDTSSWFEPNIKLLSSWLIQVEEGTSEGEFPIYRIHPKADTFPGHPRHDLLFLYSKPSSFFDESVADILSLFVKEQLPVDGYAVILGNDQSVGDVLNKLNDRKIDLIFTMGSAATAFVHETYQNGDIPVVTVLSKDPVLLGQMPDYNTGSGSNIAYTSVGVPIEVQMSYFKQLVPDLKHIAVLYAKENSSAIETQVEPLRQLAPSQGINMIDVAVVDRTNVAEELYTTLMPEAISQIRQSDPAMKQSIFLITGSSSVTNELETIYESSQNIPIVTLLPDLVREEEISPLFGIGVNFDSNSNLAGKYAFDILERDKIAGDLPVGVISPPDLAINFAQARKIGLKIPFSFFESAATIYGPDWKPVRLQGKSVQ